jgi:hypothetical protein
MSFRNSVEPYTGSMTRASRSTDIIMTSTCRGTSQMLLSAGYACAQAYAQA